MQSLYFQIHSNSLLPCVAISTGALRALLSFCRRHILHSCTTACCSFNPVPILLSKCVSEWPRMSALGHCTVNRLFCFVNQAYKLIANFSIKKKSPWNNMTQLQDIGIVFTKLALNYWHLNPDFTKLRPFWRTLSNPHEIPSSSFVASEGDSRLKGKRLRFCLWWYQKGAQGRQVTSLCESLCKSFLVFIGNMLSGA